MYDYIKGHLSKISTDHIVIETGGIGYLIRVANPYAYCDDVGLEMKLYLHQVVREDAQLLFGFRTSDEKAVFLHLISVSGIGPMTALAILAVDDNEGLVTAIDTNNITYLTKFPKIGKKTAQQMILDLAGKFTDKPTKARAVSKPSVENPNLEEAIEALMALGYKASELKKIKTIFADTTNTTENYIKLALKQLMT